MVDPVPAPISRMRRQDAGRASRTAMKISPMRALKMRNAGECWYRGGGVLHRTAGEKQFERIDLTAKHPRQRGSALSGKVDLHVEVRVALAQAGTKHRRCFVTARLSPGARIHLARESSASCERISNIRANNWRWRGSTRSSAAISCVAPARRWPGNPSELMQRFLDESGTKPVQFRNEVVVLGQSD